MVAINTSERVQRIFVPLPMPAPQDRVALKAQNTTDHSEVVFDIQRWDVQGFLLLLVVGLPENGFYEGEWEYTLAYVDGNGDTILTSGLMDAREKDAPAVVQYEANTEYKQYGEE